MTWKTKPAPTVGRGQTREADKWSHCLWIQPNLGPTYFCLYVICVPINVLLLKSFRGEFSVFMGHQSGVSMRRQPGELSGLEM